MEKVFSYLLNKWYISQTHGLMTGNPLFNKMFSRESLL